MFRRKQGLNIYLVLIGLLLLSGCRGEIARASIQKVGKFHLSFVHSSAPVEFWTDLDVEYIDETDVWYEVEISQGGEKIREITCDSFDHSEPLMARRAEVRGVIKESFLAPMSCEVGDLPDGEIQLQIDLFAGGGQVEIFRADLVIKEKE